MLSEPWQYPIVAPCQTFTDSSGDVIAVPSQQWSWDPQHDVLNSGFGNALEIPNVQYTQNGTLVGAAANQVVTMDVSADLGDPVTGGLGQDFQMWGAVPSFPPQKWQGGNPRLIRWPVSNWALLTWNDVLHYGSPTRIMSLTVGGDGAIYARAQEGGLFEDPVEVSATGFAPPGAAMVGGAQTANQMDAFVVGSDGKVYMTSETNGGTWQAPTPLTVAGFATPGAPLVTATQGGQLGVFVIDVNGRLQVIWWNPVLGWLGPVALTRASYAPTVAVLASGTRANGEVDIYAVGSDGALKYMAFNLGVWTGPYALTVTGFAPAGGPVAAALDVHGFMNVFTVGVDGALYTKWDATPLWSGPTALTSTGFLPLGANVSALNFGNTSLNAFVVDQTGALDVLSNSGSSWQAPYAVSTPSFAVPGAATEAAIENGTQLDLFTVANTGNFAEATEVSGAWSSPYPFE